tara:strand:- start:2335 stop:4290 length:1956 start_codon:yes stop_codon:yes gene_type:complete
MATVQITGNQVEIPDFALENTQEDILATLGQMVSALGGVRAEVNQGNNVEEAQLREEKKQSAETQKTMLQNIRSNVNISKDQQLGIRKLGDSVLSSQTNVTGMIQNTLQSLGAPAIVGTGIGLLMQQSQELGDAFRVGGRAGINFSENLSGVTAQLASSGIDLGEFSQIVLGNLSGIRSFGESTQEGSKRFMNLISSFRGAAEGFGNFGLTSGAAAELLAEELELRRLTMTTDAFRAQTEQEISESMVERIKQEEAMAKITGQDVKERLKAQMEARKNAIAQSFLAEQTGETREKFDKLTGSLSALGPVGEEVSKAILTAVSTGLRPEQFSQVFVQLGQPAQDLFDRVLSGIQDPGTSASDFSAAIAESVGGLKANNADIREQLRIRAANGDSVAQSLLGISQSLVDVNGDEISVRQKMIENLDEMNKQEGDARQRARGMSAELEQTEKQFQNLIQQFIFAASRQATGKEGLGSSALILAMQDFLQSGLGSETAQTAFRVGGGGVGGAVLEPFGNMATGKPMELSDMGFFLGLLMGNLPGKAGQAAKAMMLPQLVGGGSVGAANELSRDTNGQIRFEPFKDVVDAIKQPFEFGDQSLQKLANLIKDRPVNENVVIPSAQSNNQTPMTGDPLLNGNLNSPNNQTIQIPGTQY